MAIDFSKWSDDQLQGVANQMSGGQPQTPEAPAQVPMQVAETTHKTPFGTTTLKPQPGVEESAKKQAELQATQEPLIQSAYNVLKVNIAALKNLQQNSGVGRLAGAKSLITGNLTGIDPNITPMDALNDTSAWELAKIANPSGRPTEDAKNDFKKTLGSNWKTEGELSKNYQHAILIALAKNYAYIPGKKFDPNSKETQDAIKEIMSTGALPEPEQIGQTDLDTKLADISKKTGAKITILK